MKTLALYQNMLLCQMWMNTELFWALYLLLRAFGLERCRNYLLQLNTRTTMSCHVYIHEVESILPYSHHHAFVVDDV